LVRDETKVEEAYPEPEEKETVHPIILNSKKESVDWDAVLQQKYE